MSIYVNINYMFSPRKTAYSQQQLFMLINIKKIAFYGRKRLFGVSTLNSS